ncbi:MAG: diacylglycerol/lipid kinase family protein [Anaerolineae bacterium]
MIFNPVAGQRDIRRDLQQAMAYLRGQDWQLDLRETRERGEGVGYAEEARELGYEVVVAAGGDGTINEVVNGLAGTRVAVGVLPVGTGNVWALEMGIPTWTPLRRQHLIEAAKILIDGQVRTVDLGLVNDRYFLLWVGVGLDAEITREVEIEQQDMKRRLGSFAYGIAAVVVALSFVGTRATIVIDGRELRQWVLLVLVSNTQLYAKMFRVAAGARLDDGLLDLCLFRGQGILSTLRHVVSVVTQQQIQDPEAEFYQAKRVSIRTAKPLPVQVDGEPMGTTPLDIKVIPQALRVIVPRDIPQGLFCQNQKDPKGFRKYLCEP